MRHSPVDEPERGREGWRGITRGRAVQILVLAALACLGTVTFLPVQDLLHPPTESVRMRVSGRGNATTQPFQAPTQWQMAWTYDCVGVAPKGSGRFAVSVLDGEKKPIPPPAVDVSGTGDSSMVRLAGSGARYLEITSACSWSVDVSG